jgi:hypothetical protein
MRYTNQKVESARAKVTEMECRIVEQRHLLDKMVVRGHPVDQARVQLEIMDQTLTQMRAFVRNLERRFTDPSPPQRWRTKPRGRRTSQAISERLPTRDLPSSGIDVLEAAEAVVDRYGGEAPLFCARKIVDQLERGDLTRVATWLAIRQAVGSLLKS